MVKLLINTETIIGQWLNELEKCLSILNEFIPKKDFEIIETVVTPENFIQLTENETTIQFWDKCPNS